MPNLNDQHRPWNPKSCSIGLLATADVCTKAIKKEKSHTHKKNRVSIKWMANYILNGCLDLPGSEQTDERLILCDVASGLSRRFAECKPLPRDYDGNVLHAGDAVSVTIHEFKTRYGIPIALDAHGIFMGTDVAENPVVKISDGANSHTTITCGKDAVIRRVPKE